MRLHSNEIHAIRKAAQETFPPGTGVYLFGSRLDDQARGGDIDLLIEPQTPWSPQEIVERRTRFIAMLYRLIEEQRIDILIAPTAIPDSRSVVDHARKYRSLLVQL